MVRKIKTRVTELGREITQDYIRIGEAPAVLWVAHGSLYFTADLTRAIDLILPFVELIKARSYQGMLLVKDGKQLHDIKPKYVGFDIEDAFVVGYGLDLNGKYRNQPYIGVPNEHKNPDAGRARPRPPKDGGPERS